MAEETVERRRPRISINKLGEYLTGSPQNRRRVIERQKRPPGFAVSYYQPTQKAIVSFLESGGREERILDESIRILSNKTPQSDWELTRNHGCIEALEAFYNSYDKILDLENRSYKPGTNASPKLILEGVEVSIRPELLVFGQNESSERIAGAIKLYFGKSSPLDPEMGKYIATTIHQWVEEHLALENYKAPFQETGVYDVFCGNMIQAPRSYIQRRRDIRAACDEISMLWGQV